MKVAHLSEPAEERVVFRDGLGVREWRDDGAGERVEWLHLDPAFAGVEMPLRDRVTRLAKLQHVKFARILGLEPARKGKGPILVSSHVAGTRLAEVLEMAGHRMVAFDPGAGLQVTREALAALAVLHDSRNVTHGALGPERVILTASGRVVMVEHVLAHALDRLQLPRHQLWRDWRIATPPAAGQVRFDIKTDIAQAGLLALAVLLGRPLEDEEYPHRLRGLLPVVQDRLAKSPASAIAADVVAWLERLVPVDSRRAFGTVREAQQAYEALVSRGATAMGVSLARVKGVMAAVTAIGTSPGGAAGAVTIALPVQAEPAVIVAATAAGAQPAEPRDPVAPVSAVDAVAGADANESGIDIAALLALEAELEGDGTPALVAPAPASVSPPAVAPVPDEALAADTPGLDAIAQERVDLEKQFAELVATVAPVGDEPPVRLMPETPATTEPLVDDRVRWSSMPVDVAVEAEAVAVDTPEDTSRPVVVDSPEEDADAAFRFEPIAVRVPEEPARAGAIDHVPADWWKEALPWRAEDEQVAAGHVQERTDEPVERVVAVEAASTSADSEVPVATADEIDPVVEAEADASAPVESHPLEVLESLDAPDARDLAATADVVAETTVRDVIDVVDAASVVADVVDVEERVEARADDESVVAAEPVVDGAAEDVVEVVAGLPLTTSEVEADPAHDVAAPAARLLTGTGEDFGYLSIEDLEFRAASIAGVGASTLLDLEPPQDASTDLVTIDVAVGTAEDHAPLVRDEGVGPAAALAVAADVEPFDSVEHQHAIDTVEPSLEAQPAPAAEAECALTAGWEDDAAVARIEVESAATLSDGAFAEEPAALVVPPIAVEAEVPDLGVTTSDGHGVALVEPPLAVAAVVAVATPDADVASVPEPLGVLEDVESASVPERVSPVDPIADAVESGATEADTTAEDRPIEFPELSDTPVTAAASLLARPVEDEAPRDWRDALLADVSAARPWSLLDAPVADDARCSDEGRGDDLPESSFFSRTTSAEESAADGRVDVTVVAAAEAAPGAPQADAPTAEPAIDAPVPAIPEVVPEVVIVDSGHDGNAWDHLPSEVPEVAADDPSAPIASADADQTLAMPETVHDDVDTEEPQGGIVDGASAHGKKKRRRSRRKKSGAASIPATALTPVVVPQAATPTMVPVPIAGVPIVAPVVAEPLSVPPLVTAAVVQGLESTHPSMEPASADRVSGADVAASLAQDVSEPVPARARSLLDREVPAWTPPADLGALRPRAPQLSGPEFVRAEPTGVIDQGTASFTAEVAPSGAYAAPQSPPSVVPGHAVVRPMAQAAPPDVEPVLQLEQEIRVVGMPDLEELSARGGRTALTSMADAIGSTAPSAPARQTSSDQWAPSPPTSAATRGMNWRRLIAASVLIALFQGAAFAAWWWVQPGAYGTLVVQTAQDGVEVLIDGKVIGKTPIREELAPGRHKLTLRQGTQMREMPVEISLGVVTTQALDWPAADGTARGNLQVTSTPAGAEVFLNGTSRGKAPVLLEGLPAGKHELTLRGDAGSVTVVTTVIAGESTPVEVPIFAGWILVDAPVELSLVLNGEKIGSSMDGQILMPPGTHRVRATSEALGIDQSFTVTVEPGEVKRVAVRVPTAPLQLQDEPGTEVFVDGDRVGALPGALRIPLGTHDVLIRRPDGTERRQTVTVRRGDTVSL